MKIGVLTGADEKQLNLLNITLPILQQYCLKHNYDIHFFTSNVDGVHQEEGKSFFARYPFIKKHLPNYMIPKKFIIENKLKFNKNGKVDKAFYKSKY